MAVSTFRPAQTGEIVALKKVALRRLEDGIPNQALREIKALQEIEDNQYVSEAGVWTPPPALLYSLPLWGTYIHSTGSYASPPHLLPFLSTYSLLFTKLFHSSLIHFLVHPLTSFCTYPSIH